MQLNQSTIQHTNSVLIRANRGVITESELLKYFGIRLNMTLDRKRLDIREYWEEAHREGSTFSPPDYGKYGMTRHRFQYISSALRFSECDDGIVNEVSIKSNITISSLFCLNFYFVFLGPLAAHSTLH
jgi:Transposase IS4